MATNQIKARIIHKHDTEANWNLATNFIPKQGEIIVYDKDSTYNYERFKIGDGSAAVSSLPFANDSLKTEIQTLLNDKASVSSVTQLSNLINEKVDKVEGKDLSTNDFTNTLKNKLDNIADGAQVNQNAYSNITDGNTTITASSTTDTLTLEAGANITLSFDTTNDKVTISAANSTASLESLGITVTATELNYSDGVTSNIQTQLNEKADSSHSHDASDITSGMLSLERGGTGASSKSGARTNLGIDLGTSLPDPASYSEGDIFFLIV